MNTISIVILSFGIAGALYGGDSKRDEAKKIYTECKKECDNHPHVVGVFPPTVTTYELRDLMAYRACLQTCVIAFHHDLRQPNTSVKKPTASTNKV